MEIAGYSIDRRKGIGLSMFVAIWMGLFIASALMYPTHFQSVWNGTENQTGVKEVFSNPIQSIPNLIIDMFTGESSKQMLGFVATGGVTIIAASYFIGGGFALLFAIPLVVILAMINLFAFPMDTLLSNNQIPESLLIIVQMIFGGITILVAIQFMSGRGG